MPAGVGLRRPELVNRPVALNLSHPAGMISRVKLVHPASDDHLSKIARVYPRDRLGQRIERPGLSITPPVI
jgi:hypothetical protein